MSAYSAFILSTRTTRYTVTPDRLLTIIHTYQSRIERISSDLENVSQLLPASLPESLLGWRIRPPDWLFPRPLLFSFFCVGPQTQNS
jgi:hypothetical protein